MSATVTDPLVGRLVDGRYEVVSRLARGGMATVYLAVDRRLDREVALKVMHPHLAEGAGGLDFVARFRREARTAAKLAHPGLVAVFDQGVDGETSYLTMEYIDGVNLRRRITDLGALPLGEALSVAEKVLDALSTAHRAGLVHRDIKPENVLIALDGRVKLADFGLARAVTEVTSTTTGTVLGTVAYLAPELVSRGESDARTDVYACGVLLYEMITGSQPFTGTTPIHVAFQHVNNDVPAPSDAVPWLPVEVDDLVRALAARDRDERVPDAVAALALLRRTRAGLDEETLERRADVPGSPLVDEPASTDGASSDDQETARFQTRAGATVALPIGLGLPAAGEVIAVEPRAPRRRGRTAAVVTTIVLLLAALGFAGWWFGMGPGSPTTVPAIAGSTQEAATSALDAAHLKAAFTEAFDATQPEGLVVSTDPEVGTQVSRDTTVNVVISKGPDWVAIPAGLVGMTSEDAQAALTAAGLAPSVDGHRNDDVAAAGTVLSATLPDGTAADPTSAKATRGTTVSLEISDGPAPVVIATITGMTADAATALLAKDALTLTTTEAYSDMVAAGV
ncbi:MAG: Stk1 family PASTA domain-containing Ser/Thr kinase, partial [Actinobacteria bacterium]|nr:Stk1 family PASTA domain-containing Ser/Thr kinase [Actinomycetota bacterium]